MANDAHCGREAAPIAPAAEPTDGSLLKQIRGGSEDAARLLYARYAERLRALAMARQGADLAGRVDDEDIVQSAFGSFFRGVRRGDYDVPVGEDLWGLLLVITVNKVRAQGARHRAAKRDVRLTTGEEAGGRILEVLGSPDHATAFLEASVAETLDRLPEGHRLVTRLRMEGYTVEEIAQRIGRSKRSVERVLQECRDRLGRLLAER
jgi:RNA polymerase sigma-70 factor, ECF subfamily